MTEAMTKDIDTETPDRYRTIDAAFSRSIDPDAAIDVSCFLSTDRVDDDNEVVLPDGCDLGRFSKNAPLMLCHDYEGKYYPLPVGQVEWVKKRPRGLLGGVRFARGSEMGKEVKALVEENILRGVSIGFRKIAGSWMTRDEAASRADWQAAYARTGGKVWVHREWKLLELSVTPIPCNEDALFQTLGQKGMKRPDWIKTKPETHAVDDDQKATDEHPAKAIIAKTIAEVLTADQLESKGVALGSMAGSGSASAVLDRLSGLLTSYLWGLLWNDQGTPEEIADKCRKGCDEFCEAFITAATALLPLNEKSLGDAVDAVAKAYDPDNDGDDDSDGHDEEDEGPIRKGHCVKCIKGAYKGLHGKVASIHRSGFVPDVEDNVMGTKADPGIKLHAHKAMGDGHVPTDHHVGVKMSHCEKCDELKPPKRKGLNPSKAANIEILPSEVRTDEQVQAERIAAIRQTLNDPNYVQSVVKATIEQMQGVI